MKRKIIFQIGIVFLAALVFSVLISAQAIRTNPQLFSPGANSFSYLGNQGINAVPSTFNSNQCVLGTDFLVNIAPFGCEPAVVRSDLLEEQNVPVFCQLYATKINPLIDVNAIESISFTGEYPEQIAGIGFHPARAAVNPTRGTLLNNPILENIGYVVIVLRQEANESAMPEMVSGNLTARLRYDIQNAFGVGNAQIYAPVLDDAEWDDNYASYGFWNGRAFVRAEEVFGESATISVYSDANNKLYSTTLQRGGVSGQVYLPGLYCRAGTQLRLDGVVNPDTRARLNINGDIFEVARGEKFLENRCTVNSIASRGFFENVLISCQEDNGVQRMNLQVNPKIKLEINGNVGEYEIGQRVFQTEDKTKSVYLGYADSTTGSKKPEDMYIYLVSMQVHPDSLSEADLNRVAILARQLNPKEVTASGAVNALIGVTTIYAGVANLLKQAFWDGNVPYKINFGTDLTVEGKKISIKGFSDPTDIEITNQTVKTNYENAKNDYETILRSYPSEKENENTGTFGKQALQNLIELSYKANQKKTAFDLCKTFEENYNEFKEDVSQYCDSLKISSSEVSTGNVLINGRLKEISFERIYEPSKEDFSAEILIRSPEGDLESIRLGNNEVHYLNGTETVQLVDLSEISAKLRVSGNFGIGTQVFSNEINLEQNVGRTFNNGYALTLTNVNLKKFAKISVLPNVQNQYSETNLSFAIGIEKRNIQLTPDKIEERIQGLNESIEKWENIAGKLGEAVKFGNAACLAVGTTLTIKNFLGDLDGRAIARQEVMRSAGGWYDTCKSEIVRTGESLDSCLLRYDEEIDNDVDRVSGIIANQEAITEENVGEELEGIKSKINSDTITLKDKTYNFGQGSDLAAAFSAGGYKNGVVGLSQTRDVERLLEVLQNSEEGSTLHNLAETRLNSVFSDIETNSRNLAISTSTQEQVSALGIGINIRESETSRIGTYNGKAIQSSKILGIDYTLDGLSPTTAYPATIVIVDNQRFFVLLDGQGSQYNIRSFPRGNEVDFNIYNFVSASGDIVTVTSTTNESKSKVRSAYSHFVSAGSYQNGYTNPQVRYFETEPYKGLPALVPFDTTSGWYVGMKQTSPGFGTATTSNLRTYDASGQIVNYYLCNVGLNGKEEFESSIGDDQCRGFNAATRQSYDTFSGLNPSQTNALVNRALVAVERAADAHTSGVQKVRIPGVGTPGDSLDVGNPAVGIPDLQCQDFMSPEECLYLFNACDPVVCPSSRCNFGGAYQVADVVQSGIVGSTLLCLPNAKEGIVVPICLSGLKAGVDSYVSVEKNYRDCLQTNLETGETVGICDEIHSIYLCDFFWNQAQPLAQSLVPRLIETITGQGARGGGEYLGVRSAWENAGNSVDYLTNYYGATSFEAFRTGIVSEVGSAVCKSFVSTAYPGDYDFLDSLIEPRSPPQYHAWFEEAPFTTATVPPISRYKVFYHIFAGQPEPNQPNGAYYRVYLKNPQGTSAFQTNPEYNVASGFVAPGAYASDTSDFTGPQGYTQLCVRVNAQEECGFQRVTSDFAIDYLQDQYLTKQAKQSGEQITTETECVAGNPSLYSLINPNLQAGVNEILNPEVYNQQLVRVCATENPGQGTDPHAGTQTARWVEVGSCGGNLKCYLDRNSVKNAIKFAGVENGTLGEIQSKTNAALLAEGQYINDFNAEVEKIKELDSQGKISYINADLIAKAFLNAQRAQLYLLRGDAYKSLVLTVIAEEFRIAQAKLFGQTDIPFESEEARILSGVVGGTGGAGATTGGQTGTAFFGGEGGWDSTQLPSGNLDGRTITVLSGENPYKEYIAEIESLSPNIGIDTQDPNVGRVEFAKKYSNPEIKSIVDGLCEKQLLSPLDCVEINGGGYFDFNLEENVQFILDLLRERAKTACDNSNGCKIALGYKIAEIAESRFTDDLTLAELDASIKSQDVAENFQCLVLQIAFQESSIQHCAESQKSLNPLYCDQDANSFKEASLVIKSPGKENSVGAMQINLDAHASSTADKLRFYNLEQNVAHATSILYSNYLAYKDKEKTFTPTKKSYIGWEAAIRSYNGWGKGGNNNYVDEIIGNQVAIKGLFPQLCGGSGATQSQQTQPTVTGTQTTPVNSEILDREILYFQQNVLPNCRTYAGISVLPNAVTHQMCSEFRSFIDRLSNINVLSSNEYQNILNNPNSYKLDSMQPLLENKKREIRTNILTDDQCVENAVWTDRTRTKNLGNENVSPGTVFIKLISNNFASCQGYYIIKYNPEVLSSIEERIEINSNNFVSIGGEYLHSTEVSLIKKSAVNYDPNPYKFKIFNSEGNEIFESTTITANTFYAF